MVSGPLVGDEATNKAYSRTTQNKNPNHVLRHSSPPQSLTEFHGALASNDSASPNGSAPEPENEPRGYSKSGNMVRISLDSWSKAELREIKLKLMSELEQVRSLVKNLEAKEAELGERYGRSQISDDDMVDNVNSTLRRVNSEVGSVGLSDLDDNGAGGKFVGKDNKKRGLEMKQCSRNSKLPVGKEKLPPLGISKKLKSNVRTKDEGGNGVWFRTGKNPSKLFKSCSTLLEKLMKHKFGWVFNKPVDFKGLGLRDYTTIVKNPMDLGTVKTRLSKNWYKTPAGFAEDVRLTFNNAMLYNPKGQDAHLMAEQLLKMFEDKWTGIDAEYDLERKNEMSKNPNLPPPVSRKVQARTRARAPSVPPEMRPLDRSESMTKPIDAQLKPATSGRQGRKPGPKKPKAKGPDKRDMNFEEKQKLSLSLQNLPSEKLDSVVQIIRKRNRGLSQQEDEIEVDIGSVDPETLWELHRFVTSYEKSLNKNKRKAELDLQSIAEPGDAIQEMNMEPASTLAAEEPKEVGNNNNAFSPVRGEEQGDNVKESSSSSSESGSSLNDSDDDSSSACGSDSNH